MAFLIFWWLLLVWTVAIFAYFVSRYWFTRRRSRLHGFNEVPVAHTARLTKLPEYIAAFKQYRLLVRLAAGVLTVTMVAAIIISARPALIANINPVQKNRDIMLCLDASGSVLRTDAAIINRYSALVNNFQGQRFGLSLFNSSAVSIIPLNDNYQLVSQQLKTVGQAFQTQTGDTFTRLTNGTLAGFESGTSMASDGLTSCIQHLGTNSNNRSQSIILATDDELNGKPVVNMLQAIALAKERDVHIFVIDPGVSDTTLTDDHKELTVVTSQTGGGYYQLNQSNNVSSIVDAINTQASQKFVGLSQPAINDTPQAFLYIAVLGSIASLVLLWRLGL